MQMQPIDPTGYKAALYIRLSKEDENAGESQSIANQRALLRDFAQRHRLEVFDEYIDDGVSGLNFERPGFKRMIADIVEGKVNMVLTKDLSRLGRDYIQTGHYLERFFPENCVRYISLLDGVDTGLDSAANDITPFRAVINDMYARDISRKVTSVKRHKQRSGLFIGGKAPYGYKLSQTRKNTIEVDEPAAEVVREIFAMALRGKSCREIAVLLSEQGVPTPAQYAGLTLTRQGPHSGKWSAERISFMLQNEVYIGNMVQGRTRKLSYKLQGCVRLPPEEWTVVPGTHPELIEREAFEKVGLMIKSRRRTRRRKHDHPLKGLMHCHECGYPLGVITRALAGGRAALYFICRTYQRFTKPSQCTSHCTRVDFVARVLADKIQQLLASHLSRDDCARLLAQAQRRAPEPQKAEEAVAQAHTQLDRLSAQAQLAYADKLAGRLEQEDFARAYQGIKQQRTALRERIARLRRLAHNPPDIELDALIEQFAATTGQNRRLLCSLIERVELTKTGQLLVFFRFGPPERLQ